jgi:hypothetical protein
MAAPLIELDSPIASSAAEREAIIEGLGNGLAMFLGSLRTKPLFKNQIAKCFGISVDFVDELLKTIPKVRTVGCGKRGRQYTIPLNEMPLEFLMEHGFSELIAVCRGSSGKERPPGQSGLNRFERSA